MACLVLTATSLIGRQNAQRSLKCAVLVRFRHDCPLRALMPKSCRAAIYQILPFVAGDLKRISRSLCERLIVSADRLMLRCVE
jgi:hypothetical protein